MKISYNWVRSFIPQLTLSAEEVADVLTMHSFETTVHRAYTIDPTLTVCEVVSLAKHPNADRLRLAIITDGNQEVQVVCGAPNIEQGQRVVYAPTGARVYGDNGEQFTLKEAAIRGVVSPGMIMSAAELGVSDSHDGIMVLPSDMPVGSKFIDHIASDTIFDVTVLPDRAHDATTHAAIAIEVGACTKCAVLETSEVLFEDFFEALAGIAPKGSAAREQVRDRKSIAFRPDRPSQLAGASISYEDAKDILERLQFAVDDTQDVWQVTPPSTRKDVLGEHDLVDEVVRVYGLDAIEPSDIVSRMHAIPVAEAVYFEHLAKKTLCDIGFTETYSYSFEDSRLAKLVGADHYPHVELVNPMAPEFKKLRYSMLPGLIGAMIKNREDIHRSKKGQERALFEIGRAYHVAEGGVVPGIMERRVVSGITVGDVSTLQGVIDSLLVAYGIDAVGVSSTQKEKDFASVHQLMYGGEFLGMTYVLSPQLLAHMKYRLPVVAFELSLQALAKHGSDVAIPARSLDEVAAHTKSPAQFSELPKFPSVFRDVSLLVDPSVGTDAVQSEIVRVGGEMVVDVDLFDEYTPDTGKKGLAFHIEYRLQEKTLTDAEVDATHKKIEHSLKKEFDAEVR